MNQRLRTARLMAHHAAQLAVAPAFTLLPREGDDGHTALSWSTGLRAFVGPSIGGRRAGLRVADASLMVAEADKPRSVLSLPGMTRANALAWLGRHFDEVLRLPEHDLPAHAIEAGGRFGIADESTVLLARWLEGAAGVLEHLRERLPGASPVRLWSHHFDVATLVTLAPGRSVGLGLSLGDGSYDEPYWYATPWPYPLHQQRARLIAGAWHEQGWVGAVLTGAGPTDSLADASATARVEAFLVEAWEACRQLTQSP